MGVLGKPSRLSIIEASAALRAHSLMLRLQSEALLRTAGETLSRGERTLKRSRRTLARCQSEQPGDRCEVRELAAVETTKIS
jgi:hypothetical protein